MKIRQWSGRLTFCLFLGLVSMVQIKAQQQHLTPKLGINTVDEILDAMTLEEKVHLLVGTAKIPFLPPEPAPGTPVKPPLPDNFDWSTLLSNGKIKGAAGDSYEMLNYGIPSVVFADGPAGLRIDPLREGTDQTFYCTAFPIGQLLAASWDTSVVFQVGKAMGNEVHEYGVDIFLAPGMNIQRNPRTGRNFEYYAEDPVLSGSIAAAMVKGIQSNGVGTSLKHFAANNQETYRNGVDVQVSERALREIYLKSFEIAVKEGQPWTIMSSYNKINGTYASESHDLLTTILRDEWNFKGFVITDWWAEHDPVNQMFAGNDMLLPGHPQQIQQIIDAVNTGTLSQEIIDRNVKNVLNILLKTPAFSNYPYTNHPDLKNHARIAADAAAQGMVLLKNNQALPLARNQKIALYGNASYDIIVGGTGSGNVNRKYKINLDEGLINNGFTIDEQIRQAYLDYLHQKKDELNKENFWFIPRIDEMDITPEKAENAAKNSDAGIFTIHRISGEGNDRPLDDDFFLTGKEKNLLQVLSTAYHKQNKKLIIILNIGGVIETASWKNDADAILISWLPGQEAGNAIAGILSGKINPSGKLTATFPVKYEDVPSSQNFPMSDSNPSIVKYREDIFVGYRYFSSFDIKPSYAFGFGLSYTTFTYSQITVNNKNFDSQLELQFAVTNTGNVDGKEIPQLYITAPGKTLKKPAIELKKFAKTKLLKPGESQTIKMVLTASDLASFDPEQSAWVVEPGEYKVKIGASSTDMQLTETFFVKNELVTEKVNKIEK